jgi:hypothetical protein
MRVRRQLIGCLVSACGVSNDFRSVQNKKKNTMKIVWSSGTIKNVHRQAEAEMKKLMPMALIDEIRDGEHVGGVSFGVEAVFKYIIIINVFYFNCAFTYPIGSNLNKQKGSHNALLKEMGGRIVNQCQNATQGMYPIPGCLVLLCFLSRPGTVWPERSSTPCYRVLNC